MKTCMGDITELMKKVLSFIIIFVLIASCVPFGAMAENVSIGVLSYNDESGNHQATTRVLGNSSMQVSDNTIAVTVYLAELPYGAKVIGYEAASSNNMPQVYHKDTGSMITFEQMLKNDSLYLNGDILPTGDSPAHSNYKTQIVQALTDEIKQGIPTENVTGFAIRDTKMMSTSAAILIVVIPTVPAEPISETGTNPIGKLTYVDENNASKNAVYKVLGETTVPKPIGEGTIGVTVYLAELPYGASVDSYTQTVTAGINYMTQIYHKSTKMYGLNDFAEVLRAKESYLSGNILLTGESPADTTYKTAIVPALTASIKNAIPTENVTGFAIKEDAGLGGNTAILIVVIPTTDGSTINRTALDNQIARVWNGETYTDNYYRETDRWNGTDEYTKDENNPTRGFFWAAAEKTDSPLKTALAAVSQAEVDAAYAALSDAIAALIPTTEANTTLLYEAVQACENVTNGTSGSPLYTAASWNNFVEKRTAAANLMGQMFDSDGNAVAAYNNPANQTNIETTAAALVTAHGDLLSVNWADNLNTWKMAETSLLNKANLEASKYETTSWNIWSGKIAALSALQGKTITLRSDYTSWITAIQEAATAYAGLKDANSSITVHVRFADNYGAANPKYALANAAVATFDGDKTLSGNSRTLAGLLTALSYNGAQLNSGYNKYQPQLMAYINDELAVSMQSTPDRWYSVLINFVGSQTDLGQRQLHDGDRIVLVRTESPWVYRYTGQDSFSAPYRTIYPFAGLLSIQGEHVLQVEAGAPLTLEVNRTAGAPGANQRALPAADVNLIRSEAKDTQAVAAGTQALTDTGAKTGGDGKATATIYREGWYRLEAVNTTEQTNAKSADMVTITGGDYSNLFGGDYVLVHVVSSSNEAPLRAQFRAELDEVFNVHGEDFYGAHWAEVQSIYESACTVIDGNDSGKPLLGDASDAKDSAIAEIEGIAAEIEAATNNLLEAFRRVSNMLPDDASLMTKLQIQAFTRLKTIYEAMTVYQRNLLTSAQLKKYNALLTAFGEDGSALPEAKWYTLHVVIDNEADRNKYDFAMETSYVLRTVENKSERINDYGKSSYGNGANQDFLFAPGSQGMTLYLFPDGYGGAGNPAVYVSGVTVEGADYTLNERDIDSALWYRQVNPARAYLQSISFRSDTENTYAPYSDITVHLTVRSTNGEDQELATAKSTALNTLKTTYQGYKRSDYDTAEWTTLYQAYQDGVSAINAATTADGVTAALNTATSAMAAVSKKQKDANAISGWGASSAFDAGTKVGTVTITAENKTFSEGAFTGTFISKTDYPIGTNDNMMTVILRALADSGFTWEGTGGSAPDAFDIGYLAKIIDPQTQKEMGEFSGDPGSGWMGALNDFMVNEGLDMFTVAGGQLGDGDTIALMYTQNLGVDLGGSWGNSDTTLKSLEVEGGTLTPDFVSGTAGGSYDYALVISGSSAGIVVTPHATNINYMVKTFLNEKVTDDALHNSYYRRTETITVHPGDVIYVGCGERAWPSMNKQGDEARGYTATWYALHVVSESNGADYVNEQLGKLPKVTYSNYKTVQAKIAEIDAVIAKLSSSEKAKVDSTALNAAKDKVSFYQQIDAVKAKLAALPKEAGMSDEQIMAAKAQIEAAYAAYTALTEEQQGYITVGDAKNYNELVDRLKELTPSTSAQTIVGSEKKKEDEGSEIAPAQVAVAPEVVNGEAKAEIKAEDVSKALEEAPDAKTLTVKVNTEGAASVEADLPADTVNAAADAGVGLNVETEQGTVKLSAADVNAASGKDLAVSVKANADGTTSFAVTAGGTAVAANVKVELPAKDGQMLVVVGKDGKETPVILSATEGGKLRAVVPAAATVKAVDAKGMSFGDVKATDWFAGAVEFVTSRGIFNGTDKGFEPGATMNRAMLATVLFRISGETAPSGAAQFGDVAAGAWYADAVAWASAAGIVNGTDKGFEPDALVTREQIATMIYRFVKYLGADVGGASDLTKFPDGGETSAWAQEAMAWAVNAGLFKGDDTSALNPGGEATRAEVATLVERLVKLLVK